MSFKRWTKGEPQEPPFQEPELVKAALSSLGSKVNLTLDELCSDVGFTDKTFLEVTGVPASKKLTKQAGIIQFPVRSR